MLEEFGGQRDGPKHLLAALLEALDNDMLRLEIDVLPGERESLRNTAAGCGDYPAERPNRLALLLGRLQERSPFGSREILPLTLTVLHRPRHLFTLLHRCRRRGRSGRIVSKALISLG